MALGYEAERDFSEAGIEFMTAVARQCSEAIRRAQLDAERSRRSERLALLAEAGGVRTHARLPATLAEVARLAVPRLADCCIVDVIEPSGVHQVATVHVEPARIALVAEPGAALPGGPGENRSAVGGCCGADATVLLRMSRCSSGASPATRLTGRRCGRWACGR